jgi:hypothetical protein
MGPRRQGRQYPCPVVGSRCSAGKARLTGGGHNAFSRYERGEAAPLPAVINLFRLLDKHP